MKNIFIGAAIAFATLLIGCSKNGTAPVVLDEQVGNSGTPVTAASAFMSTSGQSVTGNARVYMKDNKLVLALENFSTTNGPDLHVYLSKEMYPVNFIDLGRLRATSGNQIYDIPGTPDLSNFKYVLIHCQQFNHLFGYTILK